MNSKSLIRVLCEFNSCDVEKLRETIIKNYPKNLAFLRTLLIRTTHLKINFPLIPDFLTYRGAVALFSHRGYKGITVDQYYLVRHKIDLKYPFLQCLAVRGGSGHISYFPLEVLEIIDIDGLKI